MNAHPDLEHNYWDRVFFDCSDTGIGVPNVKYLSSSVMGEGGGGIGRCYLEGGKIIGKGQSKRRKM